MTITTTSKRLGAPDADLSISALHLRVCTASDQCMHLMENGDISVILARGQDKVGKPGGDGIPCGADSTGGTVVIVLDVDHDEVHYQSGDHTRSPGDLLAEAIHVLETCRLAVRRAEGLS